MNLVISQQRKKKGSILVTLYLAPYGPHQYLLMLKLVTYNCLCQRNIEHIGKDNVKSDKEHEQWPLRSVIFIPLCATFKSWKLHVDLKIAYKLDFIFYHRSVLRRKVTNMHRESSKSLVHMR